MNEEINLQELYSELLILDDKICNMEIAMHRSQNDKEQFAANYEEYKKLSTLKTEVQHKISFVKKEAVAVGEEVKLVAASRPFSYVICKCDTEEVVGKIDYKAGDSLYLGNISCKIMPEFRGHSYAYKAFTLLNEVLSKNGIDSVIVVLDKRNIAGIKTIEKLDCTPVEGVASNLASFEIHTAKKKMM